MTQVETIKIQAIIKANYPYYNAKIDEDNAKAVVTTMTTILEDMEFELIQCALLTYMSEAHEFPPNAGQLREYAEKIKQIYTPHKEFTFDKEYADTVDFDIHNNEIILHLGTGWCRNDKKIQDVYKVPSVAKYIAKKCHETYKALGYNTPKRLTGGDENE